ncbi:IS5 family transposase [Candidatus Dependentiae bacterium]|nr:IS5 family transposase [Candidatus Dependentiae bacterium]
MHYNIKDTEFMEILKVLNQIKGIHKTNMHDLRKFIEAVYYMSRSGCQWRLLPDWYGNWRSVHKRFKYWSDHKIWQFLFEKIQRDPDMEYSMIDSTIVRAHACSAGYGKNSQEKEALGRSKGGFSTKIHALVDALGNPLKFSLTAGQRHDITQALPLTEELFETAVIADKGYDANAFVQSLETKRCSTVIPSKRNRKEPRFYDEFLYEDRNRIECFFGKIKHFRRIFSRYDKSASAFLSFVHFVGVLIWVR